MWLSLVIVSFVSGIICTIFIQVILLYQWWVHKPKEKPTHVVNRSRVKNPEELTKFFKKLTDLAEEDIKEQLRTPETCTCLNVIFAFLWKEWRDSPQMKRLFISKLTREFNDLIGAKGAKRIVEEISIRSYSLGESLPTIRDVRLLGIRSQSAEDVPDEIDMALNITYSGGFHVSADFALALNKSVYLSIKVAEITGKVKLCFRRNPTSRWSFSFFEDPEPKIELEAESRFEGKNFQQLTALFLRYFKKVIRRKYILPNYVIRYKPFLRKKIPQDEHNVIYVHNSRVTVGSVVVKVIGCSRLPVQQKNVAGNFLFCSLSVDPIPFAERKNIDPSLWPLAECEVLRGNERKIGLTFHEVTCTEGDISRKKIVVDSIEPESAAGYSSLKEGDIILEINGNRVIDAKQVSKLIKTSNRRLYILVKRPPSNLPITRTKELSKKIDTGAPLMEESSTDVDEVDSIGEEFINIVMPLIQMSSGETGPQDDINASHSEHRTSLSDLAGDKKVGKFMVDVQSSPILVRKSYEKSNENEEVLSKSVADDGEKTVTAVDRKTKNVKSCKNPQWNDTFELAVETEHKYLNVLVWYKTGLESVKEEDLDEQQAKDILLGYVTIPLTDIAMQCLATGDRFNQQEYVLVSTAYDRVLASRANLSGRPGLNRVACGGDITLAFIYKPSFDNEEEESVKTKVHTSEQIEDWVETADQATTSDIEVTKHDFVDTQFHYPTKCDFCGKKVWTKSASLCRLCGMASHKKCQQRAQMYTQCYSQQSDVAKQGENCPGNELQVDMKTLKEHGFNPSDFGSLRDMNTAIQKVKKVGKELYPELSVTNRKIKLEEMINKLQNEIDEENENRAKLYCMKQWSKPPYPVSRIDQLLTKSNQKSESLKLLMLQYCSGLVNCESEV